MIILAATIIISLSNNGIFNKAEEAVEETDLATMKTLASTAWAEAYMDGARTKEQFEAAITEDLKGYDTSKYYIDVTTSGVEVKLLSKMWIKQGLTVVKGDQTLGIGDIVHYDETAGSTKTGLRATDWKVLGADKDGNLLLVSNNTVSGKTFTEIEDDDPDRLIKFENELLNMGANLDKLCEPYGYGRGTVGKARSLTIEDVNNLTGYDKTKYGTNTVEQYANEVTVSYNNKSTKPAYTSDEADGTFTSSHDDGFYYFDGKKFAVANDLTNKTTGVITTLTNDMYSYNSLELTGYNDTEKNQIRDLFCHGSGWYWLASSSCVTKVSTDKASFGVFYYIDDSFEDENGDYVDGFQIGFQEIIDSTGYSMPQETDIKAVVTLSSEIDFTGNSTDGWRY